MKRLLLAVATVSTFGALLGAIPVRAGDVDVSIRIGHPDFFGRIDLSGIPKPPLLLPRPVIIQRAPRGVAVEPLYLRVPPEHSRNWRRYCARYDACGRPVYFVKDDWYRNTYAPHYRDQHHEWRGEERREERREEQRRDERREELRDEHRDEHRDERRDEHRDERRDDRRDEHRDRRHDDHDDRQDRDGNH